jgi:hypothetical protein
MYSRMIVNGGTHRLFVQVPPNSETYSSPICPHIISKKQSGRYDGTLSTKGPYWCCVWLRLRQPNLMRIHMHDYTPRRLEKNLYSQLPNGTWIGTLHTNFFVGPPIAYPTIIHGCMLMMLSLWHEISLVFHHIHDNETYVHRRTC